MKEFQARQGDLFFREVAAPKGNKKAQTHILAYGEVTGHAHAIIQPAFSELESVVDEKGDIYVMSNSGPITIGHEEHGHIQLPENKWICISRQREYDPASELRERRVAD